MKAVNGQSLARYDAVEYRVFWNDNIECRADLPGPWVGSQLNGSFVVYVCDQATEHRGHHIDSVAGVSWPDAVDAPRLVKT